MVVFLWLHGIGCVVCCSSEILKPVFQSLPMAMHHATNPVATGASACHEKDCCGKPIKKSPSTQSSQSESAPLKIANNGELNVCKLLAKQTVAFTVMPKSESPVAVPATLPDSLATTFTYTSDSHPAKLLEPQNRSGTYLRCCVLLI
ncbi:MAG: hypothetical protein AB1757_19945 [Acidobacteriota bacterium]